ncbi:MAG: YkgJ family cysteine cluster protein [Desulfobacteraceae bacterium]|nr:YkgJ family cysteine cluster protein [Desulfobacteraceae bacterium]
MPDDDLKNHPLGLKDGKKLLDSYVKHTSDAVCKLVDDNELSIDILAYAMQQFIDSLLPLPKEVVCKQGCAFCCHLRVGLSIPEALIIHNELMTKAPQDFVQEIQKRINTIAKTGDTVDDTFWHTTRTSCPFLEKSAGSICGVYNIRPLSCRAYHATSVENCKEGYDKGLETKIPCFPLFRSMIDMYSNAFIAAMKEKKLVSFQVEFTSALHILFSDNTAANRWLKGEDVFKTARILP